MASKHEIYVDIARYDEETNTAYGYATTEALDSYGTIIDLESVKRCLPDYMKFANIREMHELKAAGKTEEATADDRGLYIAAKVVDPVAQLKCKERVYQGFSIGAKKDYQVDNRIFLKSITEISLVDRPSNTECTIDAYRIFGKENEMDNEEVTETTSEPEVKRYAGEEIYDVATALSALDAVTNLLNWEQGENHLESAEQVASLKTAIEALKKFIASEIKEDHTPSEAMPQETQILALADESADVGRAEETPEPEPEAAPEEIERKGAELSSKNLARVQAMHDHAADMGAACRAVEECNKAASGDDVIRAADDIQQIESLTGDVSRLQTELDEAKAQISRLEAEPAPAKGVTRVVSKEAETLTIDQPEETRIEDITDPQEMIKRIHQTRGVTVKMI